MAFSEVAELAGHPRAWLAAATAIGRGLDSAPEPYPWWRVVRKSRIIKETDSRGACQIGKLQKEGWTIDQHLRVTR